MNKWNRFFKTFLLNAEPKILVYIKFVDLIESKMMNLGGSQWQCTLCHQVMKKTNLVLHIESKHMSSGGFSCDVCGKYCSTRKALTIHKSRYQHHGIGLQ
jgi:hypothetical protein